jgi:ureidoglycolate lyase
LRVGPKGAEKPAILDRDGVARDVSSIVRDFSPETVSLDLVGRLKAADASKLPALDPKARIGAPLSRVGHFVAIGLNYADHAAETGAQLPKEPILFMKATSAIIGPNDDVVIPKTSLKPDWEVELGVVIGKKASNITKEEAFDHIAGYCVVNDVSERHYQSERGGQWTKGKSPDTFGPIGPWLVTKDEVADPQSLKLWLEVDGHRYQDGNTKTMIFGVAHIVAYLSEFMSLLPGDVISTGTPPGVGMGIKPEPIWLKPGQTMRLGIDGLGEQQQRVRAYGG